MIAAFEDQIFAVCLVLCRLGGCLILAPGFSSPRFPVQVRILLAVALSLALSPLLWDELRPVVSNAGSAARIQLMVSESLFGLLIGLMARVFILAVQFAGTAIANMIGLAGIPGIPLDEAESGSPLATLLSSATVLLIISAGLHLEFIRAMLDSYSIVPAGTSYAAQQSAMNLVQALAETSLMALRLMSPFLAYAVIVNVALGLANRFTPQISVYHASTGLVMLGGFVLLLLLWRDWGSVFLGSYSDWLLKGGFGS